ncbi:MAG: 50S ribosomal protein L21 [Dehalococcoidia bacterium]|nr:50S ribosomal protein L21 [Dehalococcoidia bacterium]
MSNYAIVSTCGKQFRVRTGQVINTDLLHVEKGKEVELSPVLMIADGDEVIIGSPDIEGAKVIATCMEEGKAGKIIVFRYKNKVRSRRKTGHRQPYTRLLIKEIVKPGANLAKKTPRAKAATGGEN